MLSLRELQHQFVDTLLSDECATFMPSIEDSRESGPRAAERLAVYRGNCREGFLGALKAGYPVLMRLTGDSYFRQLVREYQREFPSPSGNLFHAGERLPTFLERRLAGTNFDYFSHVARLEWACQEVLAAADHDALDPGRLAAVPPASYPRLRFDLDPAARLVSSTYPVVRIWEAHQDAGDPEPIDLGAGGEQALVQRRGASVSVFTLPPAGYACLAALRGGQSLGAALDEAAAIDGDFDLGAELRRWAQLGFIVNFSLTGESTNARGAQS